MGTATAPTASPYDEPRIRAQLQRWKERLLDLSRGNPLLGVNRSRVTKLRVTSPSASVLFEELVVKEAALRFPLLKKVGRAANGEDDDPTVRWEVSPEDVGFDDPLDALARKMRRLYDNARTTIEERGVTTLYLTFGILDWDDPHLERSQTPLWMVPCHLDRTGPSAPLKLARADEEIQLNPALQLYLRERHKLELPALPEDATTEAMTAHLAAVRDAVRDLGWAVEDVVWLSTYTFESLVLYQDLTAMADVAVQNRLIAALARAGAEPEGSEALHDDLDELPIDRTPLPVIPTDSSQFEALARAVGGRHLVVHGPPGTGKSQTIAALIADALGRGKKILFVSAKMAALEVVYRRLREVGLADFCLEAHSTKAGKAKIIDELRRTLDSDVAVHDGADAEDIEQLQRTRALLNEYVRALHRRIEPLGLTPFQGIGRFARHRSRPDLRFDLPWRDVLDVTRAQLADVTELIEELAGQADAFDRRETHPWRGLATSSGGQQEREALEGALSTLRDAITAIEPELQALGLEKCAPSIAQLDADINALEEYGKAQSLPPGWRTRPVQELAAAAALLDQASAGRAKARRALAEHQQAFAIPPEEATRLLVPLTERFRSWWSRLTPSYWRWSREVRAQLRPGTRAGHADLVRFLQQAARYLDLNAELAWKMPEITREVGPGDASDPAVLATAAENTRRALALRAARLDLRVLSDPAEATRFHAQALVATLPSRSPALRAALEKIDASWPEGFLPGRRAAEAPAPDLTTRLGEVLAASKLMDQWVLLQRTLTRCRDTGLGPLTAALREGQVQEAKLIFERRFYSLWASAAISRSRVLEGFLGSRREDLIRRFSELDEKIRVAAARRVRATAGELAGRIRRADPSMGAASEVGILRLELGKRRRLKPLRRLFDEIPHVLQALKPCMLMSPVSVSTYLKPGSLSFDLVVFDEASQLPTQEAVPAILRSEQVVVAGDARQLPPTTFFLASFLADEDAGGAEDQLEPLDSLLDDCVAIVPHFDENDLRWHYRSRDERLIAFSNHYFYEARLRTFPSATSSTDGRGVQFVYEPDGIYGRGRDRRNPREARRVAQLVAEQLAAHPDRSIGVVAMNIDQRDAIGDAIDEELAERPDLRALWDRAGEEPAFVKALENVQGDERDTMVISVGYARDADGGLTMNFGPLNAQGGERRLNVLITRSKWQTFLVSSLRSSDLPGVNPNNKGATALKNYLAYAESGGVLPRPPAVDTDAETNEFEDAVREALIDRGLEVDAQVGAGRYRVDLAIRDARDPQRYVLGVECDGATYHSSRTARDRDLLRQNVLRGMGWRIHRLWSTEWFRDPDAAIDHVLRSLEQAMRESPERSVEATPKPFLDLVLEPTVESSDPPPAAHAALRYPAGIPYRRFVGTLHPREHLLLPRNKHYLASTIAKVVTDEAPILEDVLIERLRGLHGVARAGSNIRVNITAAPGYARWQKAVLLREDDGDHVVTRPNFQLTTFRTPTADVTRAIEEIPKEELALAVLHLVETQFGVQRERIPSEVAHLFGFDRARAPAADRIREVVDVLVAHDHLRVQGPNVYLGAPQPA